MRFSCRAVMKDNGEYGGDLFSSFWEAEAEENNAAREFESVGNALGRLAKSRFRSRFALDGGEKAYVRTKGIALIRLHAAEIVARRLAPAAIPNDGRQTPMRHGLHPVFIAQHATACCCRGCFEKWHGIPKGRRLSAAEQEFAVDLIVEWIKRQVE